MALATAKRSGNPLIPGWVVQFATYVSEKTGLRTDVVAAWWLAEGGPQTNPLNIGPHRNYGNLKGAADATVSLLRTPRYAPILASAKTNNPRSELLAIARSPWDAGHYTLKTFADKLLGAYYRLTHQQGSLTPSGHPLPFPLDPQTPAGPANPAAHPGAAISGAVDKIEGKTVLAL